MMAFIFKCLYGLCSYLQAEYNFAVQSTQMAVKWKEWEKDGDDYDLQYRTAGDDRVREEHAILDGTTLPPSDPFWNNYLPPLGWNCRCTTVQVRKDKYPRSDSAEAIAKGQSCTAKPKQKIFRFNPGKQEKIFPPKHPYYKGIEKTDCRNCTRKLSHPNNENPKCVLCGTSSNKNDIASALSKLHKLKGKEYNQQLQTITEMNVFKEHPDCKNVYWTGNDKDADLKNLLVGAKKLTADKNTKVFLLPNPGSTRTADYIVVRNNLYKDYDLKTISGKNSVGNRLSESIGQSRRVVLNMAVQYTPRTLAKKIKEYFQNNKQAVEVLILKGKRTISIERVHTKEGKFIHTFISNYNKRK